MIQRDLQVGRVRHIIFRPEEDLTMNYFFEPIWAQYYAPHLTKTELGQLRRAKSGHQSILLTEIIKKHGFDARHRTYMPVASTKDVPGRSHYVVASLIDEVGDTDWEGQCLFANALRVAAHGDEDFNAPSARVVVAPYHILTIEFDAANIGFFQQQLGWLRSPKNALDSVVGKFVAHLRSSYADVVGLSVVYSGHKSLHFHFVVSTELLSGAVPNPTSLRLGFQKTWDRLEAEFDGFASFNLPVGMKADRSLRQPETYRRLPGGMRLNDKNNHLFGIPVGKPLFQGLLWEYLKLDRSGGGKATLLDPADFMALPLVRSPAKTSKSPPTSMDVSRGIDAYACQKLAALFDGRTTQPRFSHLDRSSGEAVAHFFNHPSDQNPTSVMRAGFSTVLIQGSNPLNLTVDANIAGGLLMERLPHPLETMLEIWAGEYQREQMGPGGRMRSPVEAAFAEAAVDRPAATDAMGRILLGSLMENIGRPETHLLCAPEGISKTRSLMAATPDIIAALREANRPSWLMFAFPTYEGAEEKLEEFKAMHATSMGDMVPLLLPSLDRMYRNLCRGRACLTHERAARDGYSSRSEMILAEQPDIARAIDRSYFDLRESMKSRSPVLFTVHDVAQSWAKDTEARLLLSSEDKNCAAGRLAARETTRLGLLIHDEIDADDIVQTVASEKIERIRTLVNDMGWTSRTPLPQRWRSFQSIGCAEFTFDEVCQIAVTSGAVWQEVETGGNLEYGARRRGEDDLYASANHRRWHVRKRNWASEAAHRSLVLTTEFVPLILAEHAGGWKTTCLDTPRLPKDVVCTRPDRRLTTSSTARHVLAERDAATGQLHAIGNRLSHLADAATHASAKGSNAYIGQDIIQTLTMMPPEQYAQFQALNAWTGRTDLARIAHIDQFNQTAGRNLGFRKSGSATHRVVINRRLFDALVPVLSYARYELLDDCLEVSTKLHRRRAAKTQAAKRGRSPEMRRLVISLKTERRGRQHRDQRRFG